VPAAGGADGELDGVGVCVGVAVLDGVDVAVGRMEVDGVGVIV